MTFASCKWEEMPVVKTGFVTCRELCSPKSNFMMPAMRNTNTKQSESSLDIWPSLNMRQWRTVCCRTCCSLNISRILEHTVSFLTHDVGVRKTLKICQQLSTTSQTATTQNTLSVEQGKTDHHWSWSHCQLSRRNGILFLSAMPSSVDAKISSVRTTWITGELIYINTTFWVLLIKLSASCMMSFARFRLGMLLHFHPFFWSFFDAHGFLRLQLIELGVVGMAADAIASFGTRFWRRCCFFSRILIPCFFLFFIIRFGRRVILLLLLWETFAWPPSARMTRTNHDEEVLRIVIFTLHTCNNHVWIWGLVVQGKARSCSHGSGAYGLPTVLAGVHLDRCFPSLP